MVDVGIDRLAFYTPRNAVRLSTLAEHHNEPSDKYWKSIGQKSMAMADHHEDIVTMAAEAARPIIDATGVDKIDTVFFATETGIDQSKSAGIYVHRLLGLPKQCRNVELKQACYSATAAVQMACAYVARKPHAQVLVIASDIARYDLNSSGEATQGAGAVAILISANPKIMTIDVESGCHTEDIMDFWRPNYRKTPLVDGTFSAIKYLQSMKQCWVDYQNNGGRSFDNLSKFCYHLPFARMADKAHQHLSKMNDHTPDIQKIHAGKIYNEEVGNCYSASLYLSLVSMLDNNTTDLSGQNIGLFSYGSGAVGEFFSGTIAHGYRDYLFTDYHQSLLDNRDFIDYETYLKLWNAPDPQDGGTHDIPQTQINGRYALVKIDDHKRIYADKESEMEISGIDVTASVA